MTSTQPGLTATEAEATSQLRTAIGGLSRQLRPTQAGFDLTPSQVSVLFTVIRLGPLGLSELAEIEAINPTMLSRITAELCERSLLVRQRDPADRRAASVHATHRGRRIRERIQRARSEALGAQIGQLSAEQRATLWAAVPVLEELVARLKEPRS
jgi:DNA-binding MarR family transcriptional regulator